MSLSVLRRFSRTEQVPVATRFWDVAAEVPAQHTPEPASVVAAAAPSYVPGLCWHKAHVYLDGDRYGVTPLTGRSPYQQAAITRCEHLSRTGR